MADSTPKSKTGEIFNAALQAADADSARSVFIDDIELSPAESQRYRNHSPDGFNWGYGGSGPAQLALALMVYYCDNAYEAVERYQKFKWEVVAKLPLTKDFTLTEKEVLDWVENERREYDTARERHSPDKDSH